MTEPITLTFAEDYSDVILLDASDEEVKAALTNTDGVQLFFKGQADAVLCTKKSTFALFSRETSNELLLVTGDKIRACGAHRVIEPCRVLPRLDQLRSILASNAVTDLDEAQSTATSQDERESDDETGRDLTTETQRKRSRRSRAIKIEELLERVQASEEEVRKGLRQLGAVEIAPGMGWRVLSRSVEEKLISQFVLELKAQEFDVVNGELKEADMIQWLSEFPSFAVRSIYQKFVDNDRLNIAAFLEYQAESLLLRHRNVTLSNFSRLLKESVPDSLVVSDPMEPLKRIGLISEDKLSISYFPADALPKDPRKRCEALFGVRPFWSPKDLEAFLDGVDGGVADAVQKYARSSTNAAGERGYVKR